MSSFWVVLRGLTFNVSGIVSSLKYLTELHTSTFHFWAHTLISLLAAALLLLLLSTQHFVMYDTGQATGISNQRFHLYLIAIPESVALDHLSH